MTLKSTTEKKYIVNGTSINFNSKSSLLNNPVNKLSNKIKKKVNNNIKNINKYPNTNIDIPGVTILTIINRVKYYKNILKNYINQSYGLKELIIVVNNEKIDLEQVFEESKSYPMVRIYQLSESYSFNESIDYGIRNSIFEFISIIEDNKTYNNDYISFLLKTYWHINKLCENLGVKTISINKNQTKGDISKLTCEPKLNFSNYDEVAFLFARSFNK